MARLVLDDPVLDEYTILSEIIVEIREEDDKKAYGIWLVQLLEGYDKCRRLSVVRAHARKLARRYALDSGPLYFEEQRDNLFYHDLNAVELGISQAKGDKVILAPRYDIIVRPSGTGLGGVLMSLVIRRAKERFAELRVAPAVLGIADAQTNKERDIRNGFYRKHGFECSFPNDDQERVGIVHAKRIGDLREGINPEKVVMMAPDQLLLEMLAERKLRVTAECRADAEAARRNYLTAYFFKRIKSERFAWAAWSVLLAIWTIYERVAHIWRES